MRHELIQQERGKKQIRFSCANTKYGLMRYSKVLFIGLLGMALFVNTQIVHGEIDLPINNEILLTDKPIETSTNLYFITNNDLYDSLIIRDILNFQTTATFQNSSKLIIKITDTDKIPINSVKITSITTPFDQLPFNLITNSTGIASISGLSQGNYQFEIEKEGYKIIERSVVIGIGNTYTYIYELERISSTPFLDVSILTILLLIACIVVLLLYNKRTPNK